MATKKLTQPVTIDYETLGITSRPVYPPVPVGLSIKYPGKKAKYYAWGHPTGNNCSYGEAKVALDKAWGYDGGILCHNGKYDYDVATTHMDCPPLGWERVHDTVFLLFLNNPHQRNMSLKPSAELLLGLAPEEQDAVADWLVENQPVTDVKISKSKTSDHYFGRYIAYAPGDLVGKYANGDVERTEALFNLLHPKITEAGMSEAYDRERKLMMILLDMERRGLPINVKRLSEDVLSYFAWLLECELWILKRIKAHADLNLDSGEQLVGAMLAAGVADENLLPRTPTGKYQTNKEALLLGVTDKTLLAVLKYRTQLKTCLNTFMKPWLLVAEKTGNIYTQWNQTKSTDSGGSIGTRTGRLSSTPNFQNIPNEFKPIFDHEKPKSGLPKCPFKDLPPLPKVRGYVTAPKGHVLCGRDFSAQELRILSHFEGGDMAQGYVDNPTLDLHTYAAELVSTTTGITVTRRDAKDIAFSILYGSGLAKLAVSVGCSVEQAGALKKAYLNTFPGVKSIISDLKSRAHANLPLKTFGGRLYYCEEPKIIDGRLRDFSYKMTNYLIQGSAADQTKDAVIRYHENGSDKVAPMLLSVHDELVILVKESNSKKAMFELKKAMDAAGLDVPMVSEGEMGPNWADMKSTKD